jgi:hypothetical protein
LVRAYFEFENILRDFSAMQLLSFDRKAAEVFDELNPQKLRVGAMDFVTELVHPDRRATTSLAITMNWLVRSSILFNTPSAGISNNGASSVRFMKQ